jgi:hypothetical protein
LGERPPGHWPTRIDPALGYTPSNCAWIHKRNHRTRRPPPRPAA